MFGRTIIATLSALALAPTFAANSFPMEPSIEVHLATPKGTKHTTQIGRSETKRVTLDGVEYTLRGNGAKEDDQIDVEVTPKDKTTVRVTIRHPD